MRCICAAGAPAAAGDGVGEGQRHGGGGRGECGGTPDDLARVCAFQFQVDALGSDEGAACCLGEQACGGENKFIQAGGAVETGHGQRPHRASADAFARNVLPIVRQIQASGVSSLRGIARALDARGVATARGGTWDARTVGDLLRRGEA